MDLWFTVCNKFSWDTFIYSHTFYLVFYFDKKQLFNLIRTRQKTLRQRHLGHGVLVISITLGLVPQYIILNNFEIVV